jgi:hypothetical protein
MTSLEIKRLDSISINSPTKGVTISTTSISPKTFKSNDNDKQHKLHEIPINILKSPSYTQQLEQLQIGHGTSPKEKPKSFSSKSSLNNSLNVLATQGDNESATNIDNLKFNKYGFIQNDEATNTLNNKSKTKRQEESNLNDTNTSSLNRNQSSHEDGDEDGQAMPKNLKDYLQTTDVEEFAEQLPIKVIQIREIKWLEMLENFKEWMEKRFQKIKSRCRKGIPQSVRSKAWMHLTGAILLKDKWPNYYQECLANKKNRDVSRYVEDIKKDLHRQFPSHEIFMKKEGRQMLFNVLKAYAVHNSEVGYCQAQGPIAALLLMHMLEEDAFWILVRISDYYLKEYFKPGLEKVQIDGHALFYLFKSENSTAYKIMQTQGIDPVLYMTEWFMCIFARTLPWCTVLRVWDMFFCEGIKVLYRVGLYLMKSAFKDKQTLNRCQQQGMYETLSLLKNLPISCLNESELVKESCLNKISEKDLLKAFEKSRVKFLNQTKEINENRKNPPKKSEYKNTKKSDK